MPCHKVLSHMLQSSLQPGATAADALEHILRKAGSSSVSEAGAGVSQPRHTPATRHEFAVGTTGLIEAPPSQASTDLVDDTDDKSSWVQSMPEIPYEDVISAHSVNILVPLILIRELLSSMGHTSATHIPPNTRPRPAGYIINAPAHQHVQSRAEHDHRDRSSASMAMASRGMNTVDPGYNERRAVAGGCVWWCEACWLGGWCGRVLWTVAIGEVQKPEVVWGRFLACYGAIRVELGWGRGQELVGTSEKRGL